MENIISEINHSPNNEVHAEKNGSAKCPFSSGAMKQSAGNGPKNQDWI